MINKISNILKSDFGKIFSGNVIVQISAVLQTIIVSRILGPEGKGLFIEIILWPTIIAGFTILGLYTGIAKLSADNSVFDHWNIAKATLKATSIVGVCGTIISCFLSPILVQEHNHLIIILLIAFSPFVLINNVARGFNAIDHGRKDFTRYSITRSILNPIFFICLLILYLIDKLSLQTIILSLLFANLIVCLIRVILTLHAQRRKKQSYPVSKLFQYSLKFSVADLSEPIYAYFDKAIIALVLLSYDLGIYTTAYSAASLVGILSNVYGTKIFSDMAGGESPDLVNTALRNNLILTTFCAILLGSALPFLIPIVFGQDFSPAIIPSMMLIFTCIIQGQSYIIERSLLALGYPYAGVKAKAINMGLFAILAFSFKFMGTINIYILIAIMTFCQSFYLWYMLILLKSLCHIKLNIWPKKQDFINLIHRLLKH